MDEASAGDPLASEKRLKAVEGLTLLAISDDVEELASALVAAAALPKKAAKDAAHLAIATVHHMDFLLTWNCAHLANATMRRQIESVCKELGYLAPLICTPEELPTEP